MLAGSVFSINTNATRDTSQMCGLFCNLKIDTVFDHIRIIGFSVNYNTGRHNAFLAGNIGISGVTTVNDLIIDDLGADLNTEFP